MHRFFADRAQINEKSVVIIGDDVKHISKVLRLRLGEEIIVCDKEKNDYICVVTAISQDNVVADIKEIKVNASESEISITIYQGLPKSDKMDLIVQKCVELGAVKIVPVLTKRAVSRPNDSDKKVARWQKIAFEAAKQCGRGIIPQIGKIIEFRDAIKEAAETENSLNILPYEEENSNRLVSVIRNAAEKNINVFIGPEGGFDESEVEFACKNGIKSVTLGPRIMRTETAPIAVCAAIMYELGDW